MPAMPAMDSRCALNIINSSDKYNKTKEKRGKSSLVSGRKNSHLTMSTSDSNSVPASNDKKNVMVFYTNGSSSDSSSDE